MFVIYCEKPDIGTKIASCLGGASFKKSQKKDGYYEIKIGKEDCCVTWGYGHLCTLSDAAGYNAEYKNWRKIPLPFIPDEYKIVLNTDSKMPVKEACNVVKKLFSKADYIINATDFDREGELIFWYLYSYLRCRKKVMRMKISSTTDSGIREAYENLLDNREVEPIRKSAQCRSIADWVVGCNMTCAMTLKASGRDVLSVGRVQTPTLALVVDRDRKIESFVPEKYESLEAAFTTKKGETYKGIHKKKRFLDHAEAFSVYRKCAGKNGTVIKKDVTSKTRLVPNLYNLDSLQMEANSRYSFPLKKTLDICQKLYEKGYLTYPRTDSAFLPSDMYEPIRRIQEKLLSGKFRKYKSTEASEENMKANRKRFFDDSKVGSHYAIIPTEQVPETLTADEEKIYSLVACSVIRMLFPNAQVQVTKLVTQVAGEDFLSSGECVVAPGWMKVAYTPKEEILPNVSEQENVDAVCRLVGKETEPPKHYTEKTLLTAMISAGKTIEDEDLREFMAQEHIDGIGTVATRAGIIETLIRRGFLERSNKNLISTQKGRKLIDLIPVDAVKSASLTAAYEKMLNLIVKEEQDPDMFLQDIYRSIKQWCRQIKEMDEIKNMSQMGSTDMKCPVCGRPMNEFDWGYSCSGYKDGCRFSVGTICDKKLSKNQVKTLLEKGKTGLITGFVSKKSGKKFDAFLKLEPETDENGEIISCKIAFEFPQHESPGDSMPDLYAQCPKCKGRIVKGRWGWGCEEGCGFSVPYELCGRKFSKSEAQALISQGVLGVMDGFVSKKGKPFSAGLRLENDKIAFYFPDSDD